MNCKLCDRMSLAKEKKYPFIIHEFKHSFLQLGEHQYYPGYSILVTKDHYREMTDVPAQMRMELFEEMMTAHQAIQDALNPKKMNMCSLGNVIDHIHWHFFPRFSEDPLFNNPPWLQMHLFDQNKVSDEKRDEMINKIRAKIKQ